MPQSAQRAFAQKDLPPSVETAYYRKCIELRRRINDIEENNDNTRLRIRRLNRGVTKMRLERAFLLEQLHKLMEYNVDDSDRSSSPPPTPIDKPLRSKRSHRKTTPTPGGQILGGSVAGQHASPGSAHISQHAMILNNPLSSAASTPDPSRGAPFFSTLPPASSPHAVNGTSQPVFRKVLPPLEAQRPAESTRGQYFDAAYDDARAPAETENEYAGRPRTQSSAHAPPPPETEVQNGDGGDTEMADAPGEAGGFTSVNRG